MQSDRTGGLRLILLPAIFAVVLAAIWFLIAREPTQPDPAAGREIADAFLALLAGGDPGAAWDSTTAEFKSAMGRERFISEVRATSWLRQPLSMSQEMTVDIGGEQRSEFLYSGAAGETLRITIGREHGVWKVDRWQRE